MKYASKPQVKDVNPANPDHTALFLIECNAVSNLLVVS